MIRIAGYLAQIPLLDLTHYTARPYALSDIQVMKIYTHRLFGPHFYPSVETTLPPAQWSSVHRTDSPSIYGAETRILEEVPLPHVDSGSTYMASNAQGHVGRPVANPRHALISHRPTKRSASPIPGPSTPAKKARIRTSLPSPPSPPPKPRPPPYSASSPTFARAYKFGTEDNDPDASWSTFSAAKLGKRTAALGSGANKARNGPSSGIKKSGAFRLPGVGPGRRAKVGKATDGPSLPPQNEQKRRVITYLPPPPQMSKAEAGGPSDKETESQHAKRGLHTSTRGRKDSIIECHVLSDSEAKIGASVTAAKHQELDDNNLGTAVPLTDSDDVTLVGEDHDLYESSPPATVPFDIDDVCVRYPHVRADLKKVCAFLLYDMISPCPRDVYVIHREVRIDCTLFHIYQ